jgi:hypothetical protein
MIERALKQAARHPLQFGARLACAAVLAALVVSTGADCVRLLWFRTELARISEAAARAGSGDATEVSWSFPFAHDRLVVRASVQQSELDAAASLDTGVVFGSRGWLSDACIADLIENQAGSRFVHALATEFRAIRARLGLDDDEYLELLASAVQHMPYGGDPGGLQLPAETVVLGRGVCTDRCVLLGSLLLHEGYDTVVWVLTRPNHVALGVASNGATFRGTRYAFLETTAPRFVGQVGDECRARGPVAPPPRMVPLGGWRSYTAGPEVEAILASLARLEETRRASQRYEALARKPGPVPARFVERSTEHWVAESLATFVSVRTHQRAEVCALLCGTAAAVLPGDTQQAQ